MAQAPAELRPFESPRHYLGAELRAWRLLRSYSLARLGLAVHASGDLLGKIEKAQRSATEDLIARCDDALEAAGTLTRLYKLTLGEFEQAVGKQLTRPAGFPAKADAADPKASAGSRLSPYADDRASEVVSLAAYRRRRMASTEHGQPVLVSMSGDTPHRAAPT